MQYAIVYTASLGVIGASAWMLSQAVNDADFDDLTDDDIALPSVQSSVKAPKPVKAQKPSRFMTNMTHLGTKIKRKFKKKTFDVPI